MVKTQQIQRNAKSIFKNIDLYGADVLLAELQKYPFVSWRTKTIPQHGSPTRTTEGIKFGVLQSIEKLILHKNGMTTIKTEIGYYQFFAAGQQIKD